MKKFWILYLINMTLWANPLVIEERLDRGGANLAIGGSSASIFSNPAGLPFASYSKIHMHFMEAQIPLQSDMLRAYNNFTEVLNENIGSPMHIHANNFSSVYQTQGNFTWLLGFASSLNGSFLTHSGFGSLGAIESRIDEYEVLVSTLGYKKENLQLGLSLKAMNKYQTQHNYSARELAQNSTLSSFLNSEYQEKAFAMAVDAGLIYTFSNRMFDPTLALSVLNMGNANFDALGSIASTSNIGLSFHPYKDIVVGIDYMNLFHASQEPYEAESLKIGLTHSFLEKKLDLSTGLYNQALTVGGEYHFSYVDVGFTSYVAKSYYGTESREYLLSLGLHW